MLRNDAKCRRSGFTIIEVLVATMILSVLIAGSVSAWVFMLNLTVKVDNSGVAYSLGRQSIERIKQTGFFNTTEGATTLYYDVDAGSENAVAGGNHVYKVVTSVISGTPIDIGGGVIKPADDTLRTVTVSVYSWPGNLLIYTMGTYLARAGT
jgi:prepilin-type N-terminal cleavage/methylation domain-containing protein